MIWQTLFLVGISLPGLATTRWLWRLGLPPRIAPPRVPQRMDAFPITRSTDHIGLV